MAHPYKILIPLSSFDRKLLPNPEISQEDLPVAVHEYLSESLSGQGVDARLVVSKDTIRVEWGRTQEDPLEVAVQLLTNGKYPEGILILRGIVEKPEAEPIALDDDGIVPLTDTDWFEDDAANRVVEFISVAWPSAPTGSHLEANLTFLANNLSPKKGESSRETLRRYLCDSFFKDHLQTYKKRPIYWLFSSGKHKAFQCLVYLHRYNAGTLARMRTKYVVPLQGKLNARIEHLEIDISAADEDSTSHRKRLETERTRLIKQREELQRFDEKLRHYADQRIELDLDDGVKVNYGKFGDLLAEVKAVTGEKPKVEVPVGSRQWAVDSRQ